jgi:hypothetical protein
MGHSGEVARQAITVDDVVALKPGTHVDDWETTAGRASYQPSGKIDVSVVKAVRRTAYTKGAIGTSSQLLEKRPNHDWLLGRGQTDSRVVGFTRDSDSDP